MNKIIFINLFIFLFIDVQALFSLEYYYSNNNASKEKTKIGYNYKLLKLTLEKTKEEYGDYQLNPSKKMNKKRAILTSKNNEIKNFILNASASDELINDKNLIHLNFPTNKGIYGYRICLISSKLKNNINKYNSLEKIKKLNMAQGLGWLDSKILKFNNFNIKSYSNHSGIFQMLSSGRVDIFPRAISEVLYELDKYKYIKNLFYDESFLLYYPLPKFFFTHKSNFKAMERIKKGLDIALKDGSFDKLFNSVYKKDIDAMNLENRKIYILENPFLKTIDKTYEKNILQLLKVNK